MRTKYIVTDFFPVFQGTLVKYTTSKSFQFTNWLEAKLFTLTLKFCNLFAPKGYKKLYSVWMYYVPKYGLEDNDFLDYQNSGAWRSYSFQTGGDTLQELLDNASISETGQDGEDFANYGLEEGNHATDVVHARILAYAKVEGIK